MSSHCAANVNKTRLAAGLNQVLAEFGSNLPSSVNNGFRHMITDVLIQKVLRITARLASNIQRFDVGESGAQGF